MRGFKWEYGADYPSGAKTVTAPATVSGVALGNLPLGVAGRPANREGAKGQYTASQETCRAKWAYTSENGLTEGEHDHYSIERLNLSFAAHQGGSHLPVYRCHFGVYGWPVAYFICA